MGYLKNCDTRLANFFDTPAAQLNNSGVTKRIVHGAGHYTNKLTYSVSNSVGDCMIRSASKAEAALKAGQKAGTIGKFILKSKFLSNIADGLSKLGKAGASKIPGSGTVITAITSIFGIGKAIYHYATGDFDKGNHQLVKTAFSTVGLVAGLALAATPIGFPVALLIGMGSGFLMDSLGEVVADKLFPGAIKAKSGNHDDNDIAGSTLSPNHKSSATESYETSNYDPLYNLTGISSNSKPVEVDQKEFDKSMKEFDKEIGELQEFAESFDKH